jgi:hypothetical protein
MIWVVAAGMVQTPKRRTKLSPLGFRLGRVFFEKSGHPLAAQTLTSLRLTLGLKILRLSV